MHIYLYDNYVNQKKYDSIIARIETRITDLGLNGKIIRLGMMNSAAEAVQNEMRKGAKSIVAVGNSSLLNQIITAMAEMYANDTVSEQVPIGFIPVGKKQGSLPDLLGLPLEETACDVLSARRIEKLDLGRANNRYFLAQAHIQAEGTTVEIDKNYSIEITDATGDIYVLNLPLSAELPPNAKVSASDGILDLIINTKIRKKITHRGRSGSSVFPFKHLTICPLF